MFPVIIIILTLAVWGSVEFLKATQVGMPVGFFLLIFGFIMYVVTDYIALIHRERISKKSGESEDLGNGLIRITYTESVQFIQKVWRAKQRSLFFIMVGLALMIGAILPL